MHWLAIIFFFKQLLIYKRSPSVKYRYPENVRAIQWIYSRNIFHFTYSRISFIFSHVSILWENLFLLQTCSNLLQNQWVERMVWNHPQQFSYKNYRLCIWLILVYKCSAMPEGHPPWPNENRKYVYVLCLSRQGIHDATTITVSKTRIQNAGSLQWPFNLWSVAIRNMSLRILYSKMGRPHKLFPLFSGFSAYNGLDTKQSKK